MIYHVASVLLLLALCCLCRCGSKAPVGRHVFQLIMLLRRSNAEPVSAVVGSTCSCTHLPGQHVVDHVCAVNVTHQVDDHGCVLVVVQHVVESAELCGLIRY